MICILLESHKIMVVKIIIIIIALGGACSQIMFKSPCFSSVCLNQDGFQWLVWWVDNRKQTSHICCMLRVYPPPSQILIVVISRSVPSSEVHNKYVDGWLLFGYYLNNNKWWLVLTGKICLHIKYATSTVYMIVEHIRCTKSSNDYSIITMARGITYTWGYTELAS
jgi:hypothetical protein